MSTLESYKPTPEYPWPPHPLLAQLRSDNGVLRAFYRHYTDLMFSVMHFAQTPGLFTWKDIEAIQHLRIQCAKLVGEHLFLKKNLDIITNECYHKAIVELKISFKNAQQLQPIKGWNFLKVDL